MLLWVQMLCLMLPLLKLCQGCERGQGLGPLLKDFLAMSMMSLSTSVLEKSAFPSLLCNIKIGKSQISGLHHTFYYLTRLLFVIKFSLKHESQFVRMMNFSNHYNKPHCFFAHRCTHIGYTSCPQRAGNMSLDKHVQLLQS